MELLSALRQLGLPGAVWITFILFYTGLMLWVLKARFYLADKTFLKLDKQLKKEGMLALWTVFHVFGMTAFIVYGFTTLLWFLFSRI